MNKVNMHYEITEKILGCCFDVMNELGTGFLESVYQSALIIALKQEGLTAQREVGLEVQFRGQKVGEFYADLLVENKVIVELKACRELIPMHEAQLINYLKATGIRVGLLINFGKPRLEFARLYS